MMGASVVDMSDVDHATGAGAARRRRERRLRAYLRYARMSVAMALAESRHHTAPRGQEKARAWEGGHEMQYTAEFREPPPPPEAAGTQYFAMDFDEVPAATRPNLLLEPQGPLEWPGAAAQPYLLEHLVLDVPALQEQVIVRGIPEVLAGMLFVQEQVIVRDIPEAQASALPVVQGSAPVQEQVIVHEIPEVLAGPPVSSASASVQEQVIVCETPGVQLLGHVQEQVIVSGFPEVQAYSHVQEQVIVQEILEVQASAHVQEQVNVHKILEAQAVSEFEQVQQRTVEQIGTRVRAARGTSSSSGVELKPGESSGYGVFFALFPTLEKVRRLCGRSARPQVLMMLFISQWRRLGMAGSPWTGSGLCGGVRSTCRVTVHVAMRALSRTTSWNCTTRLSLACMPPESDVRVGGGWFCVKVQYTEEAELIDFVLVVGSLSSAWWRWLLDVFPFSPCARLWSGVFVPFVPGSFLFGVLVLLPVGRLLDSAYGLPVVRARSFLLARWYVSEYCAEWSSLLASLVCF